MAYPPAPGSIEWRGTISASKIPGILGISRFTSPYRLWHEMAGLIEPETLDPERMAWGHIAEESLAKWWLHQSGGKDAGWHLNARRSGTTEVTYFDDDLPFPNLATIDRRALNRFGKKGDRYHLVECKTAHDLEDWGKPGEDDAVPADYLSQVVWQMGVSGIHEASIVVLAYGSGPEIHQIPWNEEMFNGMVYVAQDWWHSLTDGTPPDLDDTLATYEAVRALHPDIDKGSELQLDHDTATTYLEAIAAEKEAKSRSQYEKTLMLDRMGSSQKAMLGTTKIADRRANGHGSISLYANPKAQIAA